MFSSPTFIQNCKNSLGALVRLTKVKGTSVNKYGQTNSMRKECSFLDALSPHARAARVPNTRLQYQQDTYRLPTESLTKRDM